MYTIHGEIRKDQNFNLKKKIKYQELQYFFSTFPEEKSDYSRE